MMMLHHCSDAEGLQVAIKTPRGGPPGDLDNIMVFPISAFDHGFNPLQRFLQEVHVWSKLSHENVLPLLGITTKFDLTVSIVSPWMERGNAREYVQNKAVDPRPLVR